MTHDFAGGQHLSFYLHTPWMLHEKAIFLPIINYASFSGVVLSTSSNSCHLLHVQITSLCHGLNFYVMVLMSIQLIRLLFRIHELLYFIRVIIITTWRGVKWRPPIVSVWIALSRTTPSLSIMAATSSIRKTRSGQGYGFFVLFRFFFFFFLSFLHPQNPVLLFILFCPHFQCHLPVAISNQ